MGERDPASLDYAYVTTKGRASGNAHTIEIWFAMQGETVYVLSGGGDASDWVKNVKLNPAVGVRLGERDMICRARLIEDPEEDELARRLVVEKYQPGYSGDLEEWRKSALPIAIDLPAGPSADGDAG